MVSLRLACVADMAARAEAAGCEWLSASERARLDAITAPGRRAQFLAGRWCTRQLLADEYGGDASRDWSLAAGAQEPPRLLRSPLSNALCVAISHSGDWVACAVSSQPVGLDIEAPPRRERDVAALAHAVCTPREQARLSALAGADRQAHFLVVWTLKEAWLKQRIEGVSPGRLAALHTQAAAITDANARVWCAAGLTLALAAPLAAPLQWRGGPHELAQVPCSLWRVLADS